MTPENHVRLSIATFATVILFAISTTAAAVAWKLSTEGGIEANTISIEHVTGENMSAHGRIEDLIKSNTLQIQVINPALVEIQTDLKWIRAAMERED